MVACHNRRQAKVGITGLTVEPRTKPPSSCQDCHHVAADDSAISRTSLQHLRKVSQRDEAEIIGD
jgi:hypothetical protein